MKAALRLACWALLVTLAPSFSAARAADPPPDARPPNLLLIIADDVGRERIGIYAEDRNPGRTPTLDGLGARGLVFENFWAMPSCSPTRAALLSGQYPHRTGIGSAVVPKPRQGRSPLGLGLDVEILPRALEPAGYSSALLGKWHLGTRAQGLDHPLRMGFTHHRGSFGNLAYPGGQPGYFRWMKLVDGAAKPSRVYATSDTVNEAIALAGQLAEPWLLVVSFNAAHRPLHVPPRHLHRCTALKDATRQAPLAFRAMVEAMDTEIGRLLTALSPQRPFVFFLADNGTDDTAFPVSESREGRAKGSLYESGVRVPLIVNHPSIVAPGRRVEGLASVTDLFATLVELAGVEHPAGGLPPDSVSLVPRLRSTEAASPREFLLAESFAPNGTGPYRRHARAVRGLRYKLIRFRGGTEHLYDLEADPQERHPLPVSELEGEPAEAHRRLVALLEQPPAIRDEPMRAVEGASVSLAPAAE